MSENQVLHIDCPDEKGLVYKITKVLYEHDLNILGNQEFVDPGTRHFVMRTEFEGMEGPDGLVADLEEVLPEKTNIRLSEIGQRSLVVMGTREPHCLGDLLLRHSYGEIPANIRAVICNHKDLKPLAEAFEIPFYCISHDGLSRQEHESEILNVLSKLQPDYLVLAKYMRIFSPEFVARFSNRIINIHHSFLPAFIGANPYRQAYQRGVKIIGATAHFVTDELDEGPIISQSVLPVNHSHTAEQMANAGRDVEKMVLAKAVKLVLEDRVFIHGQRTIIFD